MKKVLAGTAGAALLIAGVVVGIPVRTEARDYGQTGQAFPVIEPDLLATIETRLKRAEASGELARTNEMFAKRAEAKVRRPTPVAGITPARRAREWDFDPSVRVEQVSRSIRSISSRSGRILSSSTATMTGRLPGPPHDTPTSTPRLSSSAARRSRR